MNLETGEERAEVTPRKESGCSSCLHCRALEARVAELEKALEASGASPPPGNEAGPELRAGGHLPSASVEFKALRLVAPEGWGAGWALRPSPQRRQWMNEKPHAYHCLPLVIANQWGWQVLCPTDIVRQLENTLARAAIGARGRPVLPKPQSSPPRLTNDGQEFPPPRA